MMDGEMCFEGTTYTQPSFRNGFKAIFNVDVMQFKNMGTIGVKITIQDKNTADAATAWNDRGSASRTTTGLLTIQVSDLKEMWRIKIDLDGANCLTRLGVYEATWLPN